MRKVHIPVFFIIALSGGHGFASFLCRILSPVLSRTPFSYGTFTSLFYILCLWFYEDIKKQYKIRDDERDAVLKHERLKKSVILKNHPLLESPAASSRIGSMEELDFYFNSHEDDVAGMDWDTNGHYIFKDHKYFK